MQTTSTPCFSMLIVEDDPEICHGLQDYFALQGYQVAVAMDGEEALHILRERDSIDIVLLDVMLPKKSGFDVLRAARAFGLDCPVLMLTACAEQEMVVKGLELGAADYVTKPFSPDVLAARVKAILSRTEPPHKAPMEVYRFGGDLEVNFSTNEAVCRGEPIHLTSQEFDLLHYLLQNRGKTVSREQLLRDVWGITADIETRTTDRHMASLRKKIEPDPSQPTFIETIYGRGYRFRK